MGKADYKKINDNWRYDEENRNRLDTFYTDTDKPPSVPSKKKKKPKKRSDHKHVYEKVIFKKKNSLPPYYCFGRYCLICGKTIQDTFNLVKENPDSNVYVRLTKDIIKKRYSDFSIIEI